MRKWWTVDANFDLIICNACRSFFICCSYITFYIPTKWCCPSFKNCTREINHQLRNTENFDCFCFHYVNSANDRLLHLNLFCSAVSENVKRESEVWMRSLSQKMNFLTHFYLIWQTIWLWVFAWLKSDFFLFLIMFLLFFYLLSILSLFCNFVEDDDTLPPFVVVCCNQALYGFLLNIIRFMVSPLNV